MPSKRPASASSFYPVWLGARAEKRRAPYLVAVLGSLPFFLAGRHALVAGHHAGVIGILPVGQAIVLLLLLAELLHRRPAPAPGVERMSSPSALGDYRRDQLALVAGAALAFITAAIPLQLDKQWITIGWALETLALAWLYRRIPHRGLLLFAFGLGAAVTIRLSLNRAIFDYHPRGAVRIFNWYLYAYLVSALSLLGAALQLGRAPTTPSPRDARWRARLEQLLSAGGTLLLFLLLNIEIADWYSMGSDITFNFSSTIAQDLTYTLGWALFAIALLGTGVALRSRSARIAALLLLVVTVGKCFLHDLWRLGGLYRVASFIGLALNLALVAVVLQRFVLRKEKA